MRPLAALMLALSSLLLPAAASATAWGTLTVMAEREWTTEKEPRPRVTKFRWVEPDKVLEARHGFVSRLQFGEAKFADTVQRLVIDPKTGKINVTYTYEDGRPPLKSVIEVEADGTAIETFTDAKGVKKRNIYKSPSPSVNIIERQEFRGGAWASLGTTRKAGLTQFEIAESKRRAEEARQMAIAQENARRAAEAQRRAEQERQQAAYEQQQADYAAQQQQMQQNMPNMLDMLNGLANSINQQNQSSGSGGSSYGGSSYGGSSSGGAIIVEDTSVEDARRRAEEEARWEAVRERDRQQAAADAAATAEYYRQQEAERANAKDCWGRPVSESSGSSDSSSSGSKVCPQ
jgi:hypothetical protein